MFFTVRKFSFQLEFCIKELEVNDENTTRAELRRTKRQIDSSYDPYESKPNKTRCPLLLVADYRFFQEMGGSDTKTTINYLVRRHCKFRKNILNPVIELGAEQGKGEVNDLK